MILVVASATFREAVRSRTFLGLLAIFAFCALATRVVGWISATDGHVVSIDLVMSLQSVIGVLVAVATGTVLVQNEIQQKTLYTVLCRPLPRWHFVIGKFVGLAGALLASQAAMAAIGLAWVWITGAGLSPWLALAAAMTGLEVLVMAAVGLCLSMLTGPLLSAVLCLAVYGLGHAVATLPQLIDHLHGWQRTLAVVGASLVPNLGYFTFRAQAVHGHAMTLQDAAIALAYAGLWMALLLLISVAVFRRKQL
ncbi:MAG: ABC transporter permease [Planctomycetes bacterium]|nr:ABC transporter permease [Planctomycetota bacterium]